MAMSVLLVEDDLVQATVIKSILEDESYLVTHVASGEDVLSMSNLDRFDIILTDYDMPRMNGLELIKHLNRIMPNKPTVMMTSISDSGLAFRALREGATDFIFKDGAGEYFNVVATVIQRAKLIFRCQQSGGSNPTPLSWQEFLQGGVFENLGDGIAVINEKCVILYANRAFKEVFNISETETVNGRKITSYPIQTGPHSKAELFCGGVDSIRAISRTLEETHQDFYSHDKSFSYQVTCGSMSEGVYVLSFNKRVNDEKIENNVHRILDAIPSDLLIFDENANLLFCNEQTRKLLRGDTKRQAIELSPRAKDKVQILINCLADSDTETGASLSTDLELRCGKKTNLYGTLTLNQLEIDGYSRYIAYFIEAKHQRERVSSYDKSQQLTQSLIEDSPLCLIATDLGGKIVSVSAALEKLLHYKRDELVNVKDLTALHNQSELHKRAERLSIQLNDQVKVGFETIVAKVKLGITDTQAWTYCRKDGTTLSVNVTVSLLRDSDEKVIGYLLIVQDLNQIKQLNSNRDNAAYHDQLTGLANNLLIQDRLDSSISRVRRQGGLLGLIVFNINDLRYINQSYGPLFGDVLLKKLAQMISHMMRESDTIGRWSGDEFIIILNDLSDTSDLSLVCEKYSAMLSRSINVDGKTIKPHVLMGASFTDGKYCNADELMQQAHTALVSAKRNKQVPFKIYQESMAISTLEDTALEQALHIAFLQNNLNLHYQPILDLSEQESTILGFEAFIRWRHSSKGFISPDKYIPLAEKSGLMITLGEWILRQACDDIQDLRLRHQKNYSLSVNVSLSQVKHCKFLDVVMSALKNSGLPPEDLSLELGEEVVVEQTPQILETLEALRELGVSLIIDDFNDNIFNLTQVAGFPVNIIKIDRRFMNLDKKTNLALVSAISAIASDLELDLVAEGVESEEQLNFIRRKGCKKVQGYLYSSAVAYDELDDTVKRVRKKAGLVGS